MYAGGTVTSPQNISFTNGNYQTFTIGNNITLTFADWPTANKVGKIRLVLLDTLGDSTTRVVTWATSMEVQLSMVRISKSSNVVQK